MRLKVRRFIFIVYLYLIPNLPEECECTAPSSPATQASSVPRSLPSHLPAPTVLTETSPVTMTTTPTTAKPRFSDTLKALIASQMSSAGTGIARKLLRSGISSECSIGILQFLRAAANLEPWALRVFDATGKYPTGLFQGNIVEAGAYDECIETVVRYEDGTEKVRAQYCNFYLQSGGSTTAFEDLLPAYIMTHERGKNFTAYLSEEKLPGIRIGVCFISECTEEDLQKIVDTFLGGTLKVVVRDCVTSRAEAINTTQISIIAVLGTIAAAVIISTAIDCVSMKWKKTKTDGYLLNFLTAFSLIKNTKFIFKINRNKNSETYDYGFAHGLRFLGIFWIVLGHSYGTVLLNSSRVFNALFLFEHWHGVIITFGFQAVDTFFFLSGFFIYFKLDKENGNRVIVAVIAAVRRFIRMTVPTFFMIMCIYILPLIASGPNSKEFYNRFYAEIRAVWWDFLLLVRNWKEDDIIPILPHLWYLSTDFQLFLVSVIVIQAFKAKKALVVALFGLLSFVFCVISAWQVYDARIPPFMIALTQSYSLYLDQSNKYYKLPFYHGVCFFSGCITFLFVQKYRHRRISNIFQAACWCVALFCGLFCLFVRHAWYSRDGRAPEPTRMFYAFADRILWSVCLAWFVFACTTRKAEPLRCMLSWQGLLPLSRLSFGVYLLHSPIQMLSFHIARERTFFSHYTLVSASFAVLIWSYVLSYVMFIVCEGPTTNLETLLFTGPRRRQNEGKSAEAPASQADQKKLQLSFDNAMAFCETEDCCVAGKVCRL